MLLGAWCDSWGWCSAGAGARLGPCGSLPTQNILSFCDFCQCVGVIADEDGYFFDKLSLFIHNRKNIQISLF